MALNLYAHVENRTIYIVNKETGIVGESITADELDLHPGGIIQDENEQPILINLIEGEDGTWGL